MTAGETNRAIEATFRIERARLVAGLARIVRDVGLAEELAQDALVAALAEWPRTGMPGRPGAWLSTVARRRAVDAIRRNGMRTRKHEEAARELDGAVVDGTQAIEAAMDDDFGDELLGLLFAACHPMLSREARVALAIDRAVGVHRLHEANRLVLLAGGDLLRRVFRRVGLGDRRVGDEHLDGVVASHPA